MAANPSGKTMAEELSISIVIPMHNEANNIGRCLAALAGQELMPLEVIVVDNNSTDASVEIVSQHISKFRRSNLVLVYESTPGPAAARNKGVKHARGDVIAFTDADCVPDERWVRQITDAFIQDGTLDAVGGIERPFSERSTLIHRVVSATWLPPSGRLERSVLKSKDDWLEGKFISTFNCAIRKTCLEDIEGFDEEFYPCGEDMDLWFRAIERGAKIVAWHPKIIVEHHQALSIGALLRKMFFYGEALAHLSGQHFRGRFIFISRWFGVAKGPQSRLTGIIWNQAVVAMPMLLIVIVTGILSWALLPLLVLLFLVLLGWKLKRSMIGKGFSITLAEIPLAVAIYCIRTVAREVGLCYGSVKHKVLCI